MIQVWAKYSNGCGFYIEGRTKESLISSAKELVKGAGSSDPTSVSHFNDIHNEHPVLKIRGMQDSNERTNLSIELNEVLKIA